MASPLSAAREEAAAWCWASARMRGPAGPPGTPSPAAQRALHAAVMPLLIRLAMRAVGDANGVRRLPLADAIQAAWLAAVAAAVSYDPTRATSYAAYLTRCVHTGIARAWYDHVNAVGLPRGRFESRPGRDMTPDERRDWMMLFPARLYRSHGDDEAFASQHADPRTSRRGIADLEEAAAHEERLSRLREAIATLPAEEHDAIAAVFGLDGSPDLPTRGHHAATFGLKTRPLEVVARGLGISGCPFQKRIVVKDRVERGMNRIREVFGVDPAVTAEEERARRHRELDRARYAARTKEGRAPEGA